MVLQIPNARLVQKGRFFGQHGSHQKQYHLDKKDDKLFLYVLFVLRQKLLYAVHGDLLTGHDGVQ
jgi:hypothetical protein